MKLASRVPCVHYTTIHVEKCWAVHAASSNSSPMTNAMYTLNIMMFIVQTFSWIRCRKLVKHNSNSVQYTL